MVKSFKNLQTPEPVNQWSCKLVWSIGCFSTTKIVQMGRVAQSIGHLTRKSGVLGSIPSLATYFCFSFRFFTKGSCQLLAKVCARSTGQLLRRSKSAQEKCGKVNWLSRHDLRCLPWTQNNNATTTTIVQMMALCWPWPILRHNQLWENANT